MRVVCPKCLHDAGELPDAAAGDDVECFCGHRWTLAVHQKITLAIAPLRAARKPPPKRAVQKKPRKKKFGLAAARQNNLRKFREQLAMIEDFPYAKLQAMVGGGACAACSRLDGKIYPLRELPLPPHTFCTNEKEGCRCWFVAVSGVSMGG